MPLLASRFAILTWTNLTLLVFPFHGIHYLDLTPYLVLSMLVLFSIATLLKTRPPHRTHQRRKKRKDVVFFALGSIWPRKHRPTSRTGFRLWPLRPAG